MLDILFKKIRYKGYKYKYKFLFGRSFLLILILLLSINLCACTTILNIKSFFKEKFSIEDDINKAVDTVNEFFDLLVDKDYRRAYEYLSSEDKSKGNLEDFSNEFKNVTDIVSVDIKWVEVKNNIAIVGIDLTDFYDGEEKVFRDIEVSLVREDDGNWKVVFWK